VNRDEWTLQGAGGTPIEVTAWWPEGEPTLVLQVAHGASEHSARYGRLAERIVAEGWALVADDHRGHGRTADRHGGAGVARPGGWDAMVEDLHLVTDHIQANHPGVPVVLFGHSMGSFLAQRYAQRWGDELAGLVLSGSSYGLDGAEMIQELLAGPAADASDEPSELFAATFAGYNAPFDGPDATGYEWLSRDASEVQAYVDDPWCGDGIPLTNGFVADMIDGMVATWTPEAESGLPTSLPVMIVAGDQDPVGAFGDGVRALAARYEALGVEDLTVELYEGARHELVNETNRSEVTDDLVSWLARR
jgi:alpha-beta hydrolase superfamily lysophospholipase